MHDAQHCQLDNRPSLCNLKKLETQRCSRLPGLVLGAAIIGLMLAPMAAVAGESIEATTNQKIENALDAAAVARSAYATYFAALNPSDSTRSDFALKDLVVHFGGAVGAIDSDNSPGNHRAGRMLRSI